MPNALTGLPPSPFESSTMPQSASPIDTTVAAVSLSLKNTVIITATITG